MRRARRVLYWPNWNTWEETVSGFNAGPQPLVQTLQRAANGDDGGKLGVEAVVDYLKQFFLRSGRGALGADVVNDQQRHVAALFEQLINQRAYHRSRSRGVGARISRLRTPGTSISHCSRNPLISPIPNTNTNPDSARLVGCATPQILPDAYVGFTLALV